MIDDDAPYLNAPSCGCGDQCAVIITVRHLIAELGQPGNLQYTRETYASAIAVSRLRLSKCFRQEALSKALWEAESAGKRYFSKEAR